MVPTNSPITATVCPRVVGGSVRRSRRTGPSTGAVVGASVFIAIGDGLWGIEVEGGRKMGKNEKYKNDGQIVVICKYQTSEHVVIPKGTRRHSPSFNLLASINTSRKFIGNLLTPPDSSKSQIQSFFVLDFFSDTVFAIFINSAN